MPLIKFQSGFTLLEVLVAMVVLSLGLLGLAGLQATTLRNNQIAFNRAIAVQQTYDMADRIRANQAGAAAGSYDNLGAVPPVDPDCVTNACTAANIAVADHAQWGANNIRLLPAGSGTVTTAGGGAYDITINWNENSRFGGGAQQLRTRVQP